MQRGAARLRDEPAPHQRLVCVTTSSCWSVRQAALGDGGDRAEIRHMTNSRKACGGSFVSFHRLIAGSSPGDGFSVCGTGGRIVLRSCLQPFVPAFGRKLQDKTLTFFFLACQVCSPGAGPSAQLTTRGGPASPSTPSHIPWASPLTSWQEHGELLWHLVNIKGCCCHACHCISNAKLCSCPAHQDPCTSLVPG